MPTRSYRIKDPTIGIAYVDGHDAVVTVPAGSIVTTQQTAPDATQKLTVDWQGRRVMMFVRDLRTRAEVIPYRAA